MLISGPSKLHTPKIYKSVMEYIKEYIKEITGLVSSPTPVIIPWSRPWRLQAQEFIDEPSSPPAPAVSPEPSPTLVYSSFGEYASKALCHGTAQLIRTKVQK
jgi:hypothetical protein